MVEEASHRFATIFVVSMILGLASANFLIIQGTKASIINENPESIDNTIAIMVLIICFSAIMLALIKFTPTWLTYIVLKVFETLAVFGASIIIMIPYVAQDGLILFIATLIVILRILFRENIYLKNITSIVASAGAGAVIGASINPVPLLVLLILLSIYDFIAVFKTKHMVTLAKSITEKNLAFTFSIPTKQRKLELGTGDLVVPIAFASSVLGEAKSIYLPENALLMVAPIILASFIGLKLTLQIAEQRKQALPALPIQSALMIIAYILEKIFLF